ncbi:hypothetical protein OBV_29980 [Oscillibacter valericigenes Sjm18-20]|nr:hypothetical protein OBV_29980 [Oscillibacter valericigenes Sjm18-20]
MILLNFSKSYTSDQKSAEIVDFSGLFIKKLEFLLVLAASFEKNRSRLFLCLLRRRI